MRQLHSSCLWSLLKKKDRGADIKTGLFMAQSNTWAVVWIHTIESVSLGQREVVEGSCMCARICVDAYLEIVQGDAQEILHQTCAAMTRERVCVCNIHVRIFLAYLHHRHLLTVQSPTNQ